MHVPYSMDDSEPDLYGSLGGHCNYDPYPHSTDYNPVIEQTQGYTQKQMDDVIQYNINAVRASYDEGFRDGWTEGNQNCQHR